MRVTVETSFEMIRRMSANGRRTCDLAAAYGVNRKTIQRILARQGRYAAASGTLRRTL